MTRRRSHGLGRSTRAAIRRQAGTHGGARACPPFLSQTTRRLREFVAKLLENEGFKAIRARNGGDAWATLYHERPNLVVLDLIVAEMDGVTFSRWSAAAR